MEWALLSAAAVLVAGLGMVRARRERPKGRERRARPAPSTVDTPALTLDDTSDLEARFAAIFDEASRTVEVLVEARLDVLRHRRVPLRAVRPAPGPHAARLCFANGTVVLAHGSRPGELYNLAIGVQHHTICLESWARVPEGLTLHFAWRPKGSAKLVAVGLDQAD